MRSHRFLLLAAIFALAIDSGTLQAADGGAKPTVSMEALQRLKGMDLEANPALKGAVLKAVAGFRGKPEFVELVRDFRLTGQEDGLLEVAVAEPDSSAATEAIRMLIASGDLGRIAKGITAGEAAQADALVRAVANSEDANCVPMLVQVVSADSVPVTRRLSAVRGLARTEAGAKELLRLAGKGALDDSAKATAGLALAQSRWPAVREAAARDLPPPASGDGAPLPPVAELITLTGDPRHGAEVFRSEQAACVKCHRVGIEGTDFGPALSQIGSKLGKQALYDSILDPSAGIAFGFEGWTVELKNGEEVFGMLVSNTPEGLALKQQTGTVLQIPRAEVVRMDKQKLSAMPAGLAGLMSRKDLVDLVEYLTTLKAPVGP